MKITGGTDKFEFLVGPSGSIDPSQSGEFNGQLYYDETGAAKMSGSVNLVF